MEQSLVTFSLRFKYDCGTSAASYALRNIAVGYLYECLPLSWTRLIISRRNNIFSFTLKEVILRQSDKAEYQDSGDEKILKLLFNHFESEEEGVSNVETKRLGKIALIEPEKLVTALKILKKIYDDPHLLTKRAAADVLEGMESMLKPDVHVAEKLAMHIADVADTDDLEEKHDIVSCKVSFILSLLDNLIQEGHCVLIFSQTHKMLNLIQNSIVSRGYEFLRIDGTTKASDRVNIVNDFQIGVGASIFLLTSRVGGLGLMLTRADRVIVVDPAWNPSTDNQSVDHAYRIGQTKDVIVYRLMTCGTVEEKIYRKQIFKGGLFKTATQHKEQIRYFRQQDLRDLFSLPE